VRILRSLLACLAALLLITACGGGNGSLSTTHNYEGTKNDFSIRAKVIRAGEGPPKPDTWVVISLDTVSGETGEATDWFEKDSNRKLYAGYYNGHNQYVRVGNVSNPDNNPLSIPPDQWAEITGKIHYDGRTHENRAVFHDIKLITR
jgi:hypothetical protein